MNLATLKQLITEQYHAPAEHLWARTPDFAIFRHHHNRKWFCLVGKIAAHKLGLEGNEVCEFINVKARPEWIGSLHTMKGVLPAYHMNKGHWLTLLINQMSDEDVLSFIDDSFSLTKK